MMHWLLRLLRRKPSLPPTTANAERGAWAEDCALRHLQGRGLRLIARNYLCRDGEIDLIMRHGELLVFVEVRYRRSAAYGGALASIGAGKRRRVSHCARRYLAAHPACQRRQCRFDVVLVEGETPPHIQWLENAWQEG